MAYSPPNWILGGPYQDSPVNWGDTKYEAMSKEAALGKLIGKRQATISDVKARLARLKKSRDLPSDMKWSVAKELYLEEYPSFKTASGGRVATKTKKKKRTLSKAQIAKMQAGRRRAKEARAQMELPLGTRKGASPQDC